MSGWCAAATLTRGQVDTFLFMGFNYEQPLALDESVGLMIDSSVPEGQHTPAELLVFIHTKDGSDYIAGTGRYLNTPGQIRAYAMFSQFKPFRTSQRRARANEGHLHPRGLGAAISERKAKRSP